MLLRPRPCIPTVTCIARPSKFKKSLMNFRALLELQGCCLGALRCTLLTWSFMAAALKDWASFTSADPDWLERKLGDYLGRSREQHAMCAPHAPPVRVRARPRARARGVLRACARAAACLPLCGSRAHAQRPGRPCALTLLAACPGAALPPVRKTPLRQDAGQGRQSDAARSRRGQREHRG